MKQAGYKITQINTDHMNEFQHREVVFTRLSLAGDGDKIPYSKAIQIWDAKTDQLMLTLELDWVDDDTIKN